jgi:hypothetical protein
VKAALLALLLLAPLPAMAQILSDCRGLGSIGTAVMSPDGTITMSLRSPDGAEGVLSYPRSDPNYARMLSHLGGMRPGEHKNVPPFCNAQSGGN